MNLTRNFSSERPSTWEEKTRAGGIREEGGWVGGWVVGGCILDKEFFLGKSFQGGGKDQERVGGWVGGLLCTEEGKRRPGKREKRTNKGKKMFNACGVCVCAGRQGEATTSSLLLVCTRSVVSFLLPSSSFLPPSPPHKHHLPTVPSFLPPPPPPPPLVPVLSRVVLRTHHQPTPFPRPPVNRLDDVNHLLLVVDEEVDLIVVTSALWEEVGGWVGGWVVGGLGGAGEGGLR